METRKASSVITRYMITKGELNLYVTMAYEVGKKAQVPGHSEFEKVLEIRITDEWEPHVEVDLENWGCIWLTDYVKEINYESGDYRRVLNERRALKDAEDTSGQ